MFFFHSDALLLFFMTTLNNSSIQVEVHSSSIQMNNAKQNNEKGLKPR